LSSCEMPVDTVRAPRALIVWRACDAETVGSLSAVVLVAVVDVREGDVYAMKAGAAVHPRQPWCNHGSTWASLRGGSRSNHVIRRGEASRRVHGSIATRRSDCANIANFVGVDLPSMMSRDPAQRVA